MTELRFIGEWQLWLGVSVAAVLAAAAWRLYWRETRRRTDALRWLLPTLRALVVFLLVLMLTGPVLNHRTIIGELAHVLLFVDASESMTFTDEQMETPRKLFIAQQLGWLSADKFDVSLKRAAEHLHAAQQLAASAKSGLPAVEFNELVQNFTREVESAAELLTKVKVDVWPAVAAQNTKFLQELLTPARKLTATEPSRDAARIVRELSALTATAGKWEKDLRQTLNDYVTRVAAMPSPDIRAALERFDKTTRWQRLEAMLMGGAPSPLAQMAAKHHLELTALVGQKGEPLWWPEAGKLDPNMKAPQVFSLAPTNNTTDLSDAVRARVLDLKETQRTAVVLFSDGQHNDGTSPAETAKMLGNRNTPVFTVGLGTQNLVQDLAVLDVKGPETIFPDARVRGEIALKDDMKPGMPFTLKIEHHGQVLWEKNLLTEQKHTRAVEFDFPAKEFIAAELKRQDKDLTVAALPLNLKVSATVLEGEKSTNNNTGSLRFTAITQKPKLLLLDGRPRWEFRYLRNLFERDQRWEVNALLAGAGGEQRPWQRGLVTGTFPANREALMSYHLIVIGDLPQLQIRTDELEWMKEFVERRGGGLVFLDGRQEQLSRFTNSALASLFPVTWRGAAIDGAPVKFKLKAAGNTLAPLMLTSDALENAQLWAALPGPHWVAPAFALPGSETLVEAVAADRVVPALVFRRYGAGRVLYAAHDESWRWRYNVGDLHHQKFWNQVSKWIMEPPFPVQDKFVSLDSGPANYQPGQSADIRIRVRDAEGRVQTRANAEAQLFRDGKKVGAVALAADENLGGTFRGRTQPLTPGSYEVRVQVEGLPETAMKARTEFVVAGRSGGGSELTQLNCDEALLRQMASHSGGEFFREEDWGGLVERLKPMSKGKVVESRTILWQSYWWFTTIVLLLVAEWVLRKRAGML